MSLVKCLRKEWDVFFENNNNNKVLHIYPPYPQDATFENFEKKKNSKQRKSEYAEIFFFQNNPTVLET